MIEIFSFGIVARISYHLLAIKTAKLYLGSVTLVRSSGVFESRVTHLEQKTQASRALE